MKKKQQKWPSKLKGNKDFDGPKAGKPPEVDDDYLADLLGSYDTSRWARDEDCFDRDEISDRNYSRLLDNKVPDGWWL